MLISVDIDETKLPLEHPYEGRWATVAEQEKLAARGFPTVNLWLPIRDINGLSEAEISLYRAEARTYAGQLSSDEQTQRKALLQIARKIILAERELQVREFAKLLGHALTT